MFSYKANAICMAGMTMSAGAGVVASHCWNRVWKPGQLINYARFWPHRWTFAKNRTAHAQTHYRKSTQWQWASFVSGWISSFLEMKMIPVKDEVALLVNSYFQFRWLLQLKCSFVRQRCVNITRYFIYIPKVYNTKNRSGVILFSLKIARWLRNY